MLCCLSRTSPFSCPLLSVLSAVLAAIATIISLLHLSQTTTIQRISFSRSFINKLPHLSRFYINIYFWSFNSSNFRRDFVEPMGHFFIENGVRDY